MHIHVIPIHEGFDVDETLRWLDQSLLLPDVEPLDWAVVSCWNDCVIPQPSSKFVFPNDDHESIDIISHDVREEKVLELAVDWIEDGYKPTLWERFLLWLG